MTIKYIQQPTGNTCGPTCLKMVYEALTRHEDILEYSVDRISKICETDWIVGTPPDRMVKGMKEMGINYTEYVLMPRPYDFLRGIIKEHHYGILRTITHGIPHWIVAYAINPNYPERFLILDPWLGQIEYTEEQLEQIWSPRQYQFFEIYENSKRDTI